MVPLDPQMAGQEMHAGLFPATRELHAHNPANHIIRPGDRNVTKQFPASLGVRTLTFPVGHGVGIGVSAWSAPKRALGGGQRFPALWRPTTRG
jgi:hypothetical protein